MAEGAKLEGAKPEGATDEGRVNPPCCWNVSLSIFNDMASGRPGRQMVSWELRG